MAADVRTVGFTPKAKEFPTGEVNISDLKELVNILDVQQMADYSRPRKKLRKKCAVTITSVTITLRCSGYHEDSPVKVR
jgi:hypothetical protein